MIEQFLPYELALKLKELGFDEPCIYYFNKSENNQLWQDIGSGYYRNSNIGVSNLLWGETYDNGNVSTPLWQQSFDWFRDIYNLNILIDTDVFNKGLWEYKITSLDKKIILEPILKSHYWIRGGCFKTYEEARLECLKKLIEIIENDTNTKS